MVHTVREQTRSEGHIDSARIDFGEVGDELSLNVPRACQKLRQTAEKVTIGNGLEKAFVSHIYNIRGEHFPAGVGVCGWFRASDERGIILFIEMVASGFYGSLRCILPTLETLFSKCSPILSSTK
jgi:hypothetical protein